LTPSTDRFREEEQKIHEQTWERYCNLLEQAVEEKSFQTTPAEIRDILGKMGRDWNRFEVDVDGVREIRRLYTQMQAIPALTRRREALREKIEQTHNECDQHHRALEALRGVLRSLESDWKESREQLDHFRQDSLKVARLAEPMLPGSIRQKTEERTARLEVLEKRAEVTRNEIDRYEEEIRFHEGLAEDGPLLAGSRADLDWNHKQEKLILRKRAKLTQVSAQLDEARRHLEEHLQLERIPGKLPLTHLPLWGLQQDGPTPRG